MVKNPKPQRRFPSSEKLEQRQLFAVDSVVDNGLLTVSGDADGAVEIVAKSKSQFEVTDNGVSIGVFDGVNSIKIAIDSKGTANNVVTLKLDGASVDRVIANLGAGDKSLILANGGIRGSLSYSGGVGKDNLELATGTTIGRNVYASLGDGLNTLTDGAAIAGNLVVSGGVDDDLVTILAAATLGKNVGLDLGNGKNSITVAGSIEKSLLVKTGSGNDTIKIEKTGYVGGTVAGRLGAGDNELTHSGEIAGDLRVTSETATDKVTVATDAIVGGRTIQRLGVSSHRGHGRPAGSIAGNFTSVGLRGRR